MSGPSVPANLLWLAATSEGARWLDALPGVIEQCSSQWDLQLHEAYPDSYVSFVAPVILPQGGEAVLKVQFPHRESDLEAEALAVWDGAGAVRLLEHDPALHALLIEKCLPGTHLSSRGGEEGLGVIVGLLPRLMKQAGEPFLTLSEEAARWVSQLPGQWHKAGRPFERRLLDAALDLLKVLAATQGEQVLIHQDLHPDNVLRAQREPWLVIDPKPLTGERDFSAAPVVRSYELGHRRSDVLRRLDRLI
ncbi:MAG TPA: aminoglycoside phosphotransferase family protein, partial [Acidimicrobiia bacterium]